MNSDEIVLRLALTRLRRLKPQHLRILFELQGTAVNIYNSISLLEQNIPEATPQLRDELATIDNYIPWAKEEIGYCRDNGIDILCHDDTRFPALLNQCEDAPTVLYSLGKANYNAPHVIASVGTRRCTEYGKEICRSLYSEFGKLLPDTLIVSGLAYGIDIESHRAALKANLPTVAILAHGLDEIYPFVHRSTAKEMLAHGGGLLSEYPHGTRIDKRNFVSRNRIVAGMSHATIVVESAEKGGSLITAEMANGYNREVFACPGRMRDKYSIGCNTLIAQQKAQLLIDTESLIKNMRWTTISEPRQGELFPTLSPEEELICTALSRHEEADVTILSAETGLSLRRLSTLLGAMEMDGKVHVVPGTNSYRWNF